MTATKTKKLAKVSVTFVLFVPGLVLLVACVTFARALRTFGFLRSKFDVGLGPEPLINNVFHKRAMEKGGWSAETFVTHTYFVTQDFDYSTAEWKLPIALSSYWCFLRSIFRYQILYFYFNGGPLAWTPYRLWEGYFYRFAGVKTVVMPYGGDVHDLARSQNLKFKHAMTVDYPRFQKDRRSRIRWQIDYWSRLANHVVSGCDWVDHMWHWDTLLSSHFCIDTRQTKPSTIPGGDVIRVLHAPNHRSLKGSSFVEDAILRLQREGHPIELVLVQKKSNVEIHELIRRADVVIDQLVIGWYGMFAVEAMAHGRLVICYLRDDLKNLFEFANVTDRGGPPVLEADHNSIYDRLLEIVRTRNLITEFGARGPAYVERWHSTEALGQVFDSVNSRLLPRKK